MYVPRFLRLVLVSVLVAHVTGYLSATPLIVGADIDYAPFSYLSDGRPVGFDIELCELIATEMGVEVTYDLRPWAEVHNLARAAKIDVVLGVVYTPERDRYLDFTSPYNTFRFALLVREESDIQQVEDLKSRRLAHLDGDVVATVLMANRGVDPEYVTFPTLSAAVRSVENGSTDGVITPYEWATNAENDQLTGDLRMVTADALVSTYRMGVTRAQPELAERLERALREVMATREYEALRDKWFGPYETADQSPAGRRPDPAMAITLLLMAVIAGGIVLFVLIDRRANRL